VIQGMNIFTGTGGCAGRPAPLRNCEPERSWSGRFSDGEVWSPKLAITSSLPQMAPGHRPGLLLRPFLQVDLIQLLGDRALPG
jgi:hypothetical protein